MEGELEFSDKRTVRPPGQCVDFLEQEVEISRIDRVEREASKSTVRVPRLDESEWSTLRIVSINWTRPKRRS